METTVFIRQTAYLTTIATLFSGIFIKAEAQMQPSYIKTSSGKKLSRIHLIAVVVSFSDALSSNAAQEITLDDGTGKIVARSFENPDFFAGVQLGDILRVVGKVRAFNEQIYLIPEIIKKITNKQWITLHKLQINLIEREEKENGTHEILPITEISEKAEENEGDKAIVTEDVIVIDEVISPIEEILGLIKELDKGEGALIESIIEKKGANSEKIIHNLLENGEIFEIIPGRVKFLD